MTKVLTRALLFEEIKDLKRSIKEMREEIEKKNEMLRRYHVDRIQLNNRITYLLEENATYILSSMASTGGGGIIKKNRHKPH
jgi:hypothetical protein